jgi:DNA-binding NarL/FixJ family response regulator
VLVADPEAMDRAAMCALLDSHPSVTVVAQAGSVEAAVSLAREVRPDVWLLTVSLPCLDGSAACAAVLRAQPWARIVAISERGWDRCVVLNPPHAATTARASVARCARGADCLHLAASEGAMGTVRRSADPAALFAAVLDVARGRTHFEPGTREALAEVPGSAAAQQAPLSARELEVGALVAQGCSNKEIAGVLGISEATVKKHVGHALSKLGLLDRLQLGLCLARNPMMLQPRNPNVTWTQAVANGCKSAT